MLTETDGLELIDFGLEEITEASDDDGKPYFTSIVAPQFGSLNQSWKSSSHRRILGV